MFTEDKITEIFCIADDFCNFFDAQMKKYTFKSDKKRQYHREGRMSKAEVNIFFALLKEIPPSRQKKNELFCCALYFS